jgi:hypothetical protein
MEQHVYAVWRCMNTASWGFLEVFGCGYCCKAIRFHRMCTSPPAEQVPATPGESHVMKITMLYYENNSYVKGLHRVVLGSRYRIWATLRLVLSLQLAWPCTGESHKCGCSVTYYAAPLRCALSLDSADKLSYYFSGRLYFLQK